MGIELPVDWYRTSFAENVAALYWEEDGAEKARLALAMLEPHAGERRVLELACATGQRAEELCLQGLEVIGADVSGELLSVAAIRPHDDQLWPHFLEEDPRYLEYEEEFDLVLSLGGGAFEHFDLDEECERAFAAAARALRPGGRLLAQIPNLRHVEAQLPARTWIKDQEGTVELIEQEWSAPIRRIDGLRTTLLACERAEDAEEIAFQRRIYSLPELNEIFDRVGMEMTDIYDEHGRPCTVTEHQQELYVEGRKRLGESV